MHNATLYKLQTPLDRSGDGHDFDDSWFIKASSRGKVSYSRWFREDGCDVL